MAKPATDRGYTEHPTLPERMAHLWHVLHWRDPTHRGFRGVVDRGWWNCTPCRLINPYHRAGRIAALTDIRARIVDSMRIPIAAQKSRTGAMDDREGCTP